jgi:CubicO group peptidase (beta-lactamase class C family)
MNHKLLFVFGLLIFIACKKNETSKPIETQEAMYFPSKTDTVWEKKSISSLNWNVNALDSVRNFLIEKHSKSLMILVNGRIVVEEYYNGHDRNKSWQWNSAGKTLVSASTGIAQEEGYLNINNKVSDYLGEGWTSEPLDKEKLILVKHLLSMSSGINDEKELVIKSNLTYLADAGTRWSYHNVFQKLMDVVEKASSQTFETYFESKLADKIGMEGFWDNGIIFRIYNSNTRSMARFGLLALNKGKWQNEQIIPETFFRTSIESSQNINPSYGYLWWLNGKEKFMVPGAQTVYQSSLIPNAPANMYSAMGAADQRIYVIPDKNMVIIRMGDASDPDNPNFAVSGFDSAFWAKLNLMIGE